MTGNAHLADSSLVPFLLPTFSASAYLNSTLPPLLPPLALSTARPTSGAPLSTLSTQTATLLSTLDYQTQRLLTILTTLTDEILRLAPRLAYSVDLLRSDVVSLSEELQGHASAAVAGTSTKPSGLEQLEMLTTVRERVEEVVRVFGEVMDWSIIETEEKEKKPGKDPAGEVLYLLASGDVSGARQKVDALRVLATVFEGTVEGPARVVVVEKLEEKVRAAEEKLTGRKSMEGGGERPTTVTKKAADEKKEEGGYYGLIEQLKGLRGMS
ncbi:hypothetical protein BDD12DRAFT_328317 [Trichophaea hybrida]|nr:hypothetical protein BDD12DRAFT_328317 [Trichophaea hybrida]